MKVQPISNSYRNVNTNNTNRRDVNFGWFGGPMEPISTTQKHSIKKSVLFANSLPKSLDLLGFILIKDVISLIKDVILNKNFWNFLLKK